jgi:hypothetical protein
MFHDPFIVKKSLPFFRQTQNSLFFTSPIPDVIVLCIDLVIGI